MYVFAEGFVCFFWGISPLLTVCRSDTWGEVTRGACQPLALPYSAVQNIWCEFVNTTHAQKLLFLKMYQNAEEFSRCFDVFGIRQTFQTEQGEKITKKIYQQIWWIIKWSKISRPSCVIMYKSAWKSVET